jgi:hypothetical protein
MDWDTYFMENARRRELIPWDRGVNMAPGLCRVLVPSLQRFQVGECGGGAHLRAAARATGDPQYVAALEQFVREEQTHARLLAQAIHALGGETLARHWSEAWFIWLRRMAGLRTELFVLLTAELIGLRYYRSLRDGLAEPVLQVLFAQIVRDEEAHIAFHCDSLRPLVAEAPWLYRTAARSAWSIFFRIVCAVVVLDHAPALRAVGLSAVAFLVGCGELQAQACERIFLRAARRVGSAGECRPWRPAEVTSTLVPGQAGNGGGA